MTLTVLLAVLFSAIFHASWNFVLRKHTGNMPLLWAGMFLIAVPIVPIGYAMTPAGESAIPTMEAFSYIACSGIVHGLYFILLARAYQEGAISVVYPVARGTGVALTTVISTSFLGEQLSLVGVFGIVAIIVGIVLIRGFRMKDAKNRGVGFALATGISIAAYSILDGRGANLVHPVFYLGTTDALACLLITPYVLHRYRGMICDELQQHWRAAVFVGSASMVGYLIILYAFTLGTVSYIVAAREFSVVIGAVLGVRILGEPMRRAGLIGIAAILLGLLMIKFA